MENSTVSSDENDSTVIELGLRVTQLEQELSHTKDKLSSVEACLAAVQSRCTASETLCADLRQRVTAVYSLLQRIIDKTITLPLHNDITLDNSAVSVGDVIVTNAATAENAETKVPEPTDDNQQSSEVGNINVTVENTNSLSVVQPEWVDEHGNSASEMQVESVADSVRAAAESAVLESNFVFDSQTGLYYDYITGYYYDAEKSLYCEPQSGLYFYFDETSREYKYHSRMDVAKQKLLAHIIYGRTTAEKKGKMNRKLKRLQKSVENPDMTAVGDVIAGMSDLSLQPVLSHALDRSKKLDEVNERDEDSCDESLDELEDGELPTSDSDASSEASSAEEVAVGPEEIQNCTPCIRAMVECSDCLSAGSLFVITCTGGTIGRDAGLGHAVVIPDPLISKMHCSVEYDADRQRYTIRDHASQAGTFVNKRRLSKAKTLSKPHVIYHGDSLRLAGTTFDLHIHQRAETCSGCEPGCTKQSAIEQPAQDTVSSEDKELARRRQLKKLKNKFGLTGMNYEDHPSLLGSGGSGSYHDRAAERRETVGSDLPVDVSRAAPASVHRPISETNIGHKMLAKMGWKEGEGLGSSNRDDAIREPINVEVRLKSTAGLGAYAGTQRSMDDVADVHSSSRWIKAQDRYAKLANRNPPPTVGDPDDTAAADLSTAGRTAAAAVTQTTFGAIKWVKTNDKTT